MFLKSFLFSIFLIFLSLHLNTTFLIFVGCYAFHCWCLENFLSIIHLTFNIIRSYLFSNKYSSLKKRYGDWAVVTGSTDGIGREYAGQLASQGMNVVLISRNLAKLTEVASKIELMYGVKTKSIVIDFNEGKCVYDRIKEELRDIPIGILVNCVGRMYEYPDEISNVPVEILWSLINMNIGAMITTSRIIINRMKAQRRGAIVNISSGSELQPFPYCTLYGASKVFVRHFTLGLQYELDPYGISVQLLTPYCVQTKLHTYPIRAVVGKIFFPPVEVFTKSAVYTLGKTNETTGYWAHAIMNGAMRLLPVYMRIMIMTQISRRVQRAYIREKSNIDTATESIYE